MRRITLLLPILITVLTVMHAPAQRTSVKALTNNSIRLQWRETGGALKQRSSSLQTRASP